jgi:hypothetical protein
MTTVEQTTNNHKGGKVFGISLETLHFWVNTGYLVTVGLAFVFSFAIFLVSDRIERMANERVATLEAKTAASRAEQAALSVELERERIKRLELEKALAPRSLMPAQQAALSLALAGTAGTITIFHFSDAETTNFADQIMTSIESGGLSVSVVPSMMMGGQLPRGVIFQPSPKATASLNDAIRNALNAASVPFEEKAFRSIPNVPQDQPIVLVGAKP